MSVAVITIVRGRIAHLDNVLQGLASQIQVPDEVVVVVMGGPDPRRVVKDRGLPLTYVDLAATGDRLPLASARNLGARTTEAQQLIFLDVDCIPDAELVQSYARVLDRHDTLLMGEVRYLEPGAASGAWDGTTLHRRSRPHPARSAPKTQWQRQPIYTDHYELFWSLSFGLRRETFWSVLGGFDPLFDGYGGEDTDLAFTARAYGVALAWLGSAVAYHQHHPTFSPPVQHLASIVANARAFHSKWGSWPMQGWLEAFHDLGLVNFVPEEDRLQILREATDAERSAARLDQAVSSA